MLKAAGARGWLDERAAALESLTAITRAGADVVVSYWTKGARGLVVAGEPLGDDRAGGRRARAVWGRRADAADQREREPVFSPLGEDRYALGLETIYEGYLLHYGRPRLFAPADDDTALLLGDYLVRARPRPRRRSGTGRGGGRPRRADLALRAAARRRTSRRRRRPGRRRRRRSAAAKPARRAWAAGHRRRRAGARASHRSVG